MARPLRLVILHDDAEAANRIAASLSTDDVVVYSTTDPDEACQLVSLLRHDVLLIDIEKLIGTPVYPLQAFRQANPNLKIVGISSGQRKDTGLLLGLLDLDAHMREPVTPEALIISLPEIADRYLMVSLRNTPETGLDDRRSQEWQPNSLPTI